MKASGALNAPPAPPRPVLKLAYRMAQLRKRPGVYTLVLVVDDSGEMSLGVMEKSKLEKLG